MKCLLRQEGGCKKKPMSNLKWLHKIPKIFYPVNSQPTQISMEYLPVSQILYFSVYVLRYFGGGENAETDGHTHLATNLVKKWF